MITEIYLFQLSPLKQYLTEHRNKDDPELNAHLPMIDKYIDD